jgi:Ca2+-binding EF-hand superfamily protein
VQISTGATDSWAALQQMLNVFQTQSASDTGQNSTTQPQSIWASLTGSDTGSPFGPPPSGGPSSQFSSGTLSALIAFQAQPPLASNLASEILGGTDTDQNGALSLDEVSKALSSSRSSSSASAIQTAFARMDTNTDGQLDSDELATALQQMQQGHGRHHHHHLASSNPASTASSDPTASTTEAMGATNEATATPTAAVAA